jgi:hypothetical protein
MAIPSGVIASIQKISSIIAGASVRAQIELRLGGGPPVAGARDGSGSCRGAGAGPDVPVGFVTVSVKALPSTRTSRFDT